jgi:hypothetical protein
MNVCFALSSITSHADSKMVLLLLSHKCQDFLPVVRLRETDILSRMAMQQTEYQPMRQPNEWTNPIMATQLRRLSSKRWMEPNRRNGGPDVFRGGSIPEHRIPGRAALELPAFQFWMSSIQPSKTPISHSVLWSICQEALDILLHWNQINVPPPALLYVC